MGKTLAVDSAFIGGVLYQRGDDVPDEVAKGAGGHLFAEGQQPASKDLDVDGPAVPLEGKAADVLAWVGSDSQRAAQAAMFERARDGGPRTSLLAKLERVARSGRAESVERGDDKADPDAAAEVAPAAAAPAGGAV